MYLIRQLDNIVQTDNSTRKDIAKWLLDNLNNADIDLKMLNIDEISNLTFTSKSSLVRFGQYLGYTGWKEFYHDYLIASSSQYTEKSIDHNLPFTSMTSQSELIDNLAILYKESVEETIKNNKNTNIERAVQIINDSENVYIFALTPNDFAPRSFRRKMMSIGKSVHIVNPGEMGMTAQLITPNDCAIIISYSGNDESREPLSFIKKLDRADVPLIGITSLGGLYIKNKIKCTLIISSQERLYTKIATYSAEVSLNFIFDILFSLIMQIEFESSLNYKIDGSRGFEISRLRNQKIIDE